MQKFTLLSISTLVFFGMLTAAPQTTSAQTGALAYTPRTEAEKVAYLYGRISQLLEIQAQLRNGGSIAALGTNASGFSAVEATTYRATEIEAETAVLRGEVILFGEATASAWFEYGEDRNFLDLRTRQVRVRSAFDRAVRTSVTKLEEEEVYYFRIVTQNSDETITYGDIFSFRTDEDDDDDN